MADRRNSTIRDMTLSVGLLVVVVLVLVALFNGGFSFSPGKPSGGTTPTAQVSAGFANAGPVVGFTPVQPQHIPAAWTPNSSTVTGAGGPGDPPAAVRGGWITPDGHFVQLVESSGSVAAVLTAEIGRSGGSSGTVTVGADTWEVHPGVRTEQAWTRQAGGLTFLVTGSADQDEFRTLAAAVG